MSSIIEKGPDACYIEALANTTERDVTKAIANLKAQFTLKGHAVHDADAGGFIVVRADWSQSLPCAGFDELLATGRHLGVSQ